MRLGDVRPRGPRPDGVPKAAQDGRRRVGPLGLLVLALAVHAALPARARATSAPAGVGGGPAGSTGRRLPHGRRSSLEARVATLTRALDLDPGQQAAVRRVLLDQRQQVLRIWEAVPSAADRVAATQQVSARTADRIRAVLTEEQRKKYDPPAQADPGRTASSVHLEDWLKGEAMH